MAAYNLYRGNGSRAERIDDRHRGGQPQKPQPQSRSIARRPRRCRLSASCPSWAICRKKLGELETEDLLLILILYLMYRESGDRQLLIIMGAMYLL